MSNAYLVSEMSAPYRMTLPSLPCYPCPHGSSCCAYGTSLTDSEAAAIEADHGHHGLGRGHAAVAEEDLDDGVGAGLLFAGGVARRRAAK